MPQDSAKALWLRPGGWSNSGAPLAQRGGAAAEVTEFCRNRSWDRWGGPCRCSPIPPGQVTGREAAPQSARCFDRRCSGTCVPSAQLNEPSCRSYLRPWGDLDPGCMDTSTVCFLGNLHPPAPSLSHVIVTACFFACIHHQVRDLEAGVGPACSSLHPRGLGEMMKDWTREQTAKNTQTWGQQAEGGRSWSEKGWGSSLPGPVLSPPSCPHASASGKRAGGGPAA